jgi:multidrug efflux pump subunit AcrB
MALEKCTNCERTIGNLETPYLFKNEVVCKDCHGRLSQQNLPQQATSQAVVTRAVPVQERIVVVQEPQTGRIQTIERTGKKWKALMLISVLMTIAGFIAFFGNQPHPAVVLFPLGIVFLVISKIGAWWFHG